MKFWNSSKSKTIDVNGYIIDENTMELINVPAGLDIYKIPPIAKSISFSSLRAMAPTATIIDFQQNEYITSLPWEIMGPFYNFLKLKKIVYPPNMKKMEKYIGLDILNRGIEIVLPHNLEQFALNQFTPSMTRLELEDSVTSIYGGIVTHNNILKELVVSGGVKKLNSHDINQTKSLEKLWLKEGIEEMDGNAIYGCDNLTEIHIPSSLRHFKLGVNDLRHMKGYDFDGRSYHPTPEQIEKSRKRTIKLYKTVKGKEVLFEIKADEFLELLETPGEFIFQGFGNTYRMNKASLGNIDHFIVRADDKKSYQQSKPNNANDSSNKQDSASPVFINSIHIRGKREEPNIENKTAEIERLLKLKLSATKKVKNPTTGDFDIISKSRSEIENEMVYIIEELDDCYDEGKLDNKSYHEYLKDIRQIYQEFIANAPMETKTNAFFQPKQQINSQKEKYDQLLEQFIGSLLIPEDITTTKNDRPNPNRRNK